MIDAASFGPSLLGIHRFSFAVDQVAMKCIFCEARPAGIVPEELGIALVFGEQQRRAIFEPQLELAERLLASTDRMRIEALQFRARCPVTPAPSVAKPERRKHVKRRRLGRSVDDG